MLDKNYEKLELNKIINIIESYCVTSLGKSAFSSLEPSSNILVVKHLLSETTQAKNLIQEAGNAPISEINDPTRILKLLKSSQTLSCGDLLSIAHFLKISRELKQYFSSTENPEKFDSIENYFSRLYSNIDIENAIFKAIIDDNNVADEASSTLRNIRRKKRNLESSVKDNLNKLIHSSTYSKFIMDPIVTIRNNRYVIPVKIEYKDSIKGFVHDMSYSGSTVFIEPISIFDLNNEIHNLQLDENVEIERILKDFSEQLYPITNNLQIGLDAFGNIDAIFAKAKYSLVNDCIEPIINDSKNIKLINARHPLIDPKIVVPITVEIGQSFNSLIITGPNTGGKTVTLKTVGLLCLMSYMGLHIPANENTTIYVFDKIFADIGDEQSIQESLSTFSSHMINIIEIYNHATSKSLILVDELGSGTDPLQGANLAISILEYFYKLGALSLATTHYQEIKHYALITDGFENASSEFDIENLRPTYKLLVGVPGKSNAFAITKRLGMPDIILDRAQDLMEQDSVSVEELIKNIYDNKIEIENEKDKIRQNSNQIELLRKSLDNKNYETLSKENEIIENAKMQAREILLNAKKEANSIISELNELCNNANSENLKHANSIRNKLNDKIKDTSDSQPNSVKEIDENTIQPNQIQKGMTVLVKSVNQEGIVISLPNKSNEVQVQIGSMKMNSKLSNLILKKTTKNTENKGNPPKAKSYKTGLKAKTASMEVNVIGNTVDEAIFVVDKFLDDSYLSSLKTVRIVHGKGTGKLREGIHQFLRTHPHVKNFRLGTFGEGEMGVTVVELK